MCFLFAHNTPGTAPPPPGNVFFAGKKTDPENILFTCENPAAFQLIAAARSAAQNPNLIKMISQSIIKVSNTAKNNKEDKGL